SANSSVGSKDQLPSLSTGAVPTSSPSMITVTTDPGSAVPPMVGVVSLVAEPSLGVSITGGAGGVWSATVKLTGLDGLDVLPSIAWIAEMVCRPMLSGSSGVSDQLPSGSTVAVPSVR